MKMAAVLVSPFELDAPHGVFPSKPLHISQERWRSEQEPNGQPRDFHARTVTPDAETMTPKPAGKLHSHPQNQRNRYTPSVDDLQRNPDRSDNSIGLVWICIILRPLNNFWGIAASLAMLRKESCPHENRPGCAAL